MSWPPSRPEAASVPHRPWDPKHPADANLVHEHEKLVYVVVDESVEEWLGLSVARWPHADPEGRLRFVDPEGPVAVGTSTAGLQRFLGPAGARKPRVGTTFAARVTRGTASDLIPELRDRAGHGEVRIDDLGAHLTRPIDLTEQGRLLAKLACYGAMLSTLPSVLEDRWNLVEDEES